MTATHNAARNARIFELWDQNLSYGAIAFRLGISRESVAGVVFRARRNGQIAAATDEAKIKARKRADGLRPRPVPAPRLRVRRVQTATRSVAVLHAGAPVPPAPKAPAAINQGWHDAAGCAFICNDDVAHPSWCNAPVAVLRSRARALGSWCPYHLAKVVKVVVTHG
jgi:hypothetical protein